MNLARIVLFCEDALRAQKCRARMSGVLDLVPTAWQEGDPERLKDGKLRIRIRHGSSVRRTADADSTFTITDKVYDRAMPIELNDRADAFGCELHPQCFITRASAGAL